MIPRSIKKTNLHIALPILILVYIPNFLIGKAFITAGEPVPADTIKTKIGTLAFIAAASAFFRLSKHYNPMINPQYLFFLAMSPWTHKKPLPNGPITLSYLDLPVLLLTTFLIYIDMPHLTLVPALAFFAVYLTVMTVSLLNVEQFLAVIPIAFILPLVVYPFKSLNFAIIICLIIYLIMLFAFDQWKRDFPQNTIYWKSDYVEQLKKQGITKKIVGYPYTLLSDVPQEKSLSFMENVIISALLTWYLHVIISLTKIYTDPYWIGLLLFVIGFGLVLLRIMSYLKNYHSPISFWGRVFTGKLIIPGYDIIWASPICAFLCATLLPAVLCFLSVPLMISAEIACFTSILCMLAMPPSLKDWRLTGHHRITKPVQPKQPIQLKHKAQ